MHSENAGALSSTSPGTRSSRQLTPQCIVSEKRREGFAMKLWRTDVQVAECSGRFNIATASVTAICHQNATSKFLGIDFVRKFGGERGIRTLEGLMTLTPLAGVRLRPLGHLSAPGERWCVSSLAGGCPAAPRAGRP